MSLKTDDPKAITPTRKAKIAASLIFWPWNALFLSLVFFGVVPHVLIDLLRDTSRGLIPWDLTLTIVCLMCIPLVSVAWGVRLVHEPRKLVALFYGLEAPLFLLCVSRIFLVRELTPALTQIGVCSFLAGAFFAYELAFGVGRRRPAAHAQLAGQTVVLGTGLYLGAILSFYVPVAGFALGKWFFAFEWVRPFTQMILNTRGMALVIMALSSALLACSATLFLAAPIALILLYCHSFYRVYQRCRVSLGTLPSRAVLMATVAVLSGLFLVLNHQPQKAAFALLSHVPTTDDERTRLIAAQEDIRLGLTQAYLAPYRFLSARGENSLIRELYQRTFNFSAEAATTVQSAQDLLIAPVLYDGESMSADQVRAEKLYAEFFDTPIQKRERTGILRALSATWQGEQRQAGLLNQDQRRVKLLRQEVRVTEGGATAEIEIHDQYENQTFEQQEILLYVSLPESAVITGLWLGESEDRQKRFAFTVSPRGAAQAVYRGEVARRADPALIEQVGPGQYRLRAFPVPPKPRDLGMAPPLHLWLTYLASPENGRWPTPHLSERRNVYWDDSTERTFGGRSLRREQEEWVGVPLPAEDQVMIAATQEAVLPGGRLIRREPLQPGRIAAPKGERFAIVVDRSFSMSRVEDEVKQSLAAIASVGKENDVDMYLTSAATRGETPERVDDLASVGSRPLLFFGAGSLKQLLRQFDELRAGTIYDGIFVLTDDDSFDSADDTEPPKSLAAPLWIIHLGGQLAAGYDDNSLELLNRSGGGVTTTFVDALLRYTARRQSDRIINVDSKSIWTLEETTKPETPVDGFARLAARQLILALSRQYKQGDVGALDTLHRLAVTYGLVSIYSSMIVLVDDAQRRALMEAESKSDRFDRQVESGKEVVPTPQNPLALTATPEPHEWVLIGLALIAALVAIRQRRHVLRVS